MTIQYCDRCGVELIEGEQSGHVMGIDDANNDGHGNITDEADLCAVCYEGFRCWLKLPEVTKRARQSSTIHIRPHPKDMHIQLGDRVQTGPDGNLYGTVTEIRSGANEDKTLEVELEEDGRLERWAEKYTWLVPKAPICTWE